MTGPLLTGDIGVALLDAQGLVVNAYVAGQTYASRPQTTVPVCSASWNILSSFSLPPQIYTSSHTLRTAKRSLLCERRQLHIQ
eukprot:scaffold996_cov409-Prasinococcus_capsulatus_cf.AAC.16